MSSSTNRMISLYRTRCNPFLSINTSNINTTTLTTTTHVVNLQHTRGYSKMKRLSKKELEALEEQEKSLEEIHARRAEEEIEAMNLPMDKSDYNPTDIPLEQLKLALDNRWAWFEQRVDLMESREKRKGDLEPLLDEIIGPPMKQNRETGETTRVPESAREQFERQLGIPENSMEALELEEKLMEEMQWQMETKYNLSVLENKPLFRETPLQEFRSKSDEAYQSYVKKRGFGYYSKPSYGDYLTREKRVKHLPIPTYATEEERKTKLSNDLITLHHKMRHKDRLGHHNLSSVPHSKYPNPYENVADDDQVRNSITQEQAEAYKGERKEIMDEANRDLGSKMANLIGSSRVQTEGERSMMDMLQTFRHNGLTNPNIEKIPFYEMRKEFVANKYEHPISDIYSHLFSEQALDRVDELDMTRMVSLPPELYEKSFAGGIGGDLHDTFEQLYHRALMLREPAYPILKHMQRVKKHITKEEPLKQDDPANVRGHVLVGQRGSGKSSCLATTVAHAHQNGFLVFYIPSAREWTHGVHFIEPSAVIKGYFDAPMVTEDFAKGFIVQNEEILKKMPLSKDYELPVEPGQKQPTNLYELVSFGLLSYNNMSAAFKFLLDELSRNKDVPMLFAIDDYNFFMDNTGFKFGNLNLFDTTVPKKVHATEYMLVRGLNRIMLQNNPNHVFAAAYSNKWKTENAQPYTKNVLDVVDVPRYNLEELRTILDYYQSVHYIYPDFHKIIEDVVYLSGAVPGQVFREMQLV